MFGRAYYGGRYFGPRYFGDGDDTVAPPVFGGPIPDISKTENTGAHSFDLGQYFTGATEYSIAPAVEAGWTFDTVTGELEIDTDAVGVFGPYVVTGTNVSGSDDSNGFTVTVVAAASEQPSGGWLTFLNTYEQQLKRRREEARKRRELEEATEQIEDSTDRQIAQLLRVQEAKDARRQEFEQTARLARANADLDAARQYSERVAKALEAVIENGTRASIERLEKELKRAQDEEQFLMLAILLSVE